MAPLIETKIPLECTKCFLLINILDKWFSIIMLTFGIENLTLKIMI